MSRGIVTASPSAEVGEAARRMGRGPGAAHAGRRGRPLVGMLSLADLARSCDMEAAAALADISSSLRRLRNEHDG